MKVKVNGGMEAWHGIWPAKKNSRRIVCVLEGSAHTGLDVLNEDEEGAEYLGTHYSRRDGEYFDWYRLPRGVEIVRTAL